MDPTLLLVVLFLGFSLATATAIRVYGEWTSNQDATVDQRLGKRAARPLAQAPSHEDDGAAIVRWFRRVVAETGLAIGAQEGFLLMILVGTALGAAAFLYRDDLPSGLVGFLAGMTLTIVILLVVGNRRRAAILEQLPEVTDFLSRSIRAGESLDQAIVAAGATVSPPLGKELRRCAQQLAMGLSMSRALRHLIRRAPLMEMRLLATSLIVQRESGGNLANVLDRLTFVFRDRLHYKRQYRAATTGARLSAVFIVCVSIVVACHAAIVRPDEMREALAHPLGKALVATAIVLEVIGIVATIVLLRSDY